MLLDQIIQVWSEIDQHPAHPIYYGCDLSGLKYDFRVAVYICRGCRYHLRRLILFFALIHLHHSIPLLNHLILLLFLDVLLRSPDLDAGLSAHAVEAPNGVGGPLAQLADLLHHLGERVFGEIRGVRAQGVQRLQAHRRVRRDVWVGRKVQRPRVLHREGPERGQPR